MSFERRYGEDQRHTIYELKRQGKTGSEIARLCALGTEGLEAFEISRDMANKIARQERELHELSPLAQSDLTDAVRVLTRRTINVLEKWLRRLEKRRRDIDTMELKRMTDCLVKLHRLVSQMPPEGREGNGHKPLKRGFIEELAAAEDDAQPEAT